MYQVKPINLDLANSLLDYELTNRVFTNIVLSFDKDNPDLKSQLASKSIPIQTVYYLTTLDMQVLNSGIYGYFGNYNNRYDIETKDALKNLGMSDLASLFEEVSVLSSQDFEAVKSFYDSFDKVYYKKNRVKSMDAHLKEYILEHIEVFETQY